MSVFAKCTPTTWTWALVQQTVESQTMDMASVPSDKTITTLKDGRVSVRIDGKAYVFDQSYKIEFPRSRNRLLSRLPPSINTEFDDLKTYVTKMLKSDDTNHNVFYSTPRNILRPVFVIIFEIKPSSRRSGIFIRTVRVAWLHGSCDKNTVDASVNGLLDYITNCKATSKDTDAGVAACGPLPTADTLNEPVSVPDTTLVEKQVRDHKKYPRLVVKKTYDTLLDMGLGVASTLNNFITLVLYNGERIKLYNDGGKLYDDGNTDYMAYVDSLNALIAMANKSAETFDRYAELPMYKFNATPRKSVLQVLAINSEFTQAQLRQLLPTTKLDGIYYDEAELVRHINERESEVIAELHDEISLGVNVYTNIEQRLRRARESVIKLPSSMREEANERIAALQTILEGARRDIITYMEDKRVYAELVSKVQKKGIQERLMAYRKIDIENYIPVAEREKLKKEMVLLEYHLQCKLKLKTLQDEFSTRIFELRAR